MGREAQWFRAVPAEIAWRMVSFSIRIFLYPGDYHSESIFFALFQGRTPMLRREDVEAPRRSSRPSDDPTASSQRSVGTVPHYQGQTGPSRRSADIPRAEPLQRSQGRRSVVVAGWPGDPFCGLDIPAWDIPEGFQVGSCSLGLDDVPSVGADMFQTPEEVPEV